MTSSREGSGPRARPPAVVYICGPAVGDELRYSLRTLVNVPHADVWIVGHRPDWIRNVGHIPTTQDGTKFQNALGNTRAAVMSTEIPDDMVLWDDDFFALRKTSPAPNWHRGPVREIRRSNPNKIRRQERHADGLAGTAWLLTRWGYHEPLNYELHVPFRIDRPTMAEALRRASTTPIVALHPRTLYGNVAQIGGREHGDVKIPHRHAWPKPGSWLSTNEHSFSTGKVGQFIRDRFPDPSPYEQEGV